MSSINDFINFEYHVTLSRHIGECDEQYKRRLRAYSLGMEVGMKQRQDEIDELQKKIDDAINCLEKNKPSLKMEYKHAINALSILKGDQP